MNIFDHLNNLSYLKNPPDFSNDEFKKSYNKFMINRWISMVDLFVPIVNEINKYDIPENVHYVYYQSIIPKRKYFFKYIKRSKDLTEKDKEYIARYFEVGKKEAETYINILDEEQIDEILNIYKYGKNKMV